MGKVNFTSNREVRQKASSTACLRRGGPFGHQERDIVER